MGQRGGVLVSGPMTKLENTHTLRASSESVVPNDWLLSFVSLRIAASISRVCSYDLAS